MQERTGIPTLVAGALTPLVLLLTVASAQAGPEKYAVKFLCGSMLPSPVEGPVKPGNYQTAINVHNPNSRRVRFSKHAILLFDSDNPDMLFETPHRPEGAIAVRLDGGWGLEIDCPAIRLELLQDVTPPPTGFIKGFVVIASNQPLDVVAAYTGHGYDLSATLQPEGFSLQVLPISPSP